MSFLRFLLQISSYIKKQVFKNSTCDVHFRKIFDDMKEQLDF
jgi:hypothetical protein